jgi:hypothetical protein
MRALVSAGAGCPVAPEAVDDGPGRGRHRFRLEDFRIEGWRPDRPAQASHGELTRNCQANLSTFTRLRIAARASDPP